MKLTLVLLFLLICIQFISIYVIVKYKKKTKEYKSLIKDIYEIQENERKSIANDLHNVLSGDLNAIRNYLTVLFKKDGASQNIVIYNEIRTGIDDAIHFNRQLSHKLVPSTLNRLGFLEALKEKILDLKLKSNIIFELDCNKVDMVLDYQKSYILYSVICDYIFNRVSDENCKSCKILIYFQKKLTHIEIIDDGERFTLNTNNSSKEKNNVNAIFLPLKGMISKVTKLEVLKGNHISIQINNYL